jgi:outer membrane protein assembly factor BamB
VERGPLNLGGRTRTAAREVAALLAVLLAVGVMAMAFVWPWLPRAPLGGPALERYAPIRDGEARLTLRTAPDGTRQGWESQSAREVPGMRVATDLRSAPGSVLIAVATSDGTALHDGLARLRINEVRTLALGADGQSKMTYAYAYRDAAGDHLVGFTDAANDRDSIFEPPPLTLPAALDVGAQWETTGKLGLSDYRWTGRVLEQGPYSGPLGQFDDCLLIDTRSLLAQPDGSQSLINNRDRWCAGVGDVESQSLDPVSGAVLNTTVVITADESLASAGDAPPAPSLPVGAAGPGDQAPDFSTWKMARVGRARGGFDSAEATIPPVWLPTDPPVVLAAGYGGDLIAFDVSSPGSLIRWSFHPEGAAYGMPAFDAATGRVFFGTSDKHLYALDARGLFLWRFETGDNVAARPLVVGDIVVIGSEDGGIYGLDAATGAQRWSAQAGGAVVSSPVLVGNVVVVGSDNQTVYGLDATTGAQVWSYAAAGAVEAPIVADESGSVFVASRSGTLAAVPAAACTASGQQACAATWEAKPGAALRTAPLVVNDRVLAVDEDGTLVALRTEDGKRLWTDTGRTYVGAPVLVGDSVIATGQKGDVYRLLPDGEHLKGWSAADAVSPTDPTPSFQYGPTLGGDYVWIADASAVIRRIGPPLMGDIPSLDLAWYDGGTSPPFVGAPIRWTPVEYNGQALLLDYRKQMVAVNPATGAGSRLLTLPGEADLVQIDPVVSGDVLLTVQNETLQAFDLRARRLLWQVPGAGGSIRPPVVAGDVALWVSGKDGQGVLLALDLATGAERWRAAVPISPQGTGVVTADGVAYVGGQPAAFDVATGAPHWQMPLDGMPVGGPAISPDGSTLYVGMLRTDTSTGAVVALDGKTGAERWRTDIGDAIPRPIEALWLEDGVLVVPDLVGRVVALDATTGAERWRFVPPGSRLASLTVARGRVWFMLENARFYALDLKSGRPVARFADLELSLNAQGLNQRPLVVGDRVLMPIGLALLGFDVPEDAP